MTAPTRRRVLGAGGLGVLGLGAASSFAAAAPGPYPDAELIGLCAAFLENDRRFNALHEPWYETPVTEIPAWVDEESEALVDESHCLLCEIGSTPARTYEGMVAKARAALAHASITDDKKLDKGSDVFVAHSLCRDLLRGVA